MSDNALIAVTVVCVCVMFCCLVMFGDGCG